ncbi:LacI family DNA-binding transcriptional regulator [Macrococcoides caseolyticum]|uniref:LacI family DNA-binding transcriptional regulator n=1 Tax=Macrococcoides caseolyticum TaxID=69966 RepID=UPI001F1EE90C|nr:LacI family DNA-binding transcriptional regulator [Macrococcus caseolyticus]MCE4956003.1 LacI family DNA-binding transcriptional regulator [Macrococcus caseolyticus]
MPTIKDVARESGVSVATVSRAINNSGYVHEDTLKKINNAIESLNYKPNETARSLYNKQSKIIGLLLPDITNPFFTLVARGVEDTALEHGFHIIIGNSDQKPDKEMSYIETFQLNNCVGFISSSLQSVLSDDKKKFNGMHHVMLDRVEEGVVTVEADHQKGGMLQANCLIDAGCKHVLVISGSSEYSSFNKRFQTACETLKEQSINYDVMHVKDVKKDLLDRIRAHHFDGVICCNDMCAIQVMGILQSNGYVIPADIKVIGFDDIQISESYYPSISTVRQPAYYLGKVACLNLIHLIQNKEIEQHVIVDVSLIERNSTRSV